MSDTGRSRLDDLLAAQPSQPLYVSPRRTKAVRRLRLILPLLAACLLVVVIVIAGPGHDDPPPNIKDIAPNQIGKNALEAPRFESQDGDAQPYTITASHAYQKTDNLNIAVMGKPVADMLMKDGSWIAIQSQAGAFNQSAQFLALRGGVKVFHDSGYELTTQSLDVHLPQQEATTTTAVEGHGPMGQITATGLSVNAATSQLRFLGPAKLTITTSPPPTSATR
ncbi:MAG: LPS export ABC transporter periplasmic protein LptC [Pseudomonadota bacterium]